MKSPGSTRPPTGSTSGGRRTTRPRSRIRDGTRGAAFRDRARKPYVPQAPLWRALIWTGARWGELTAARWADVDLEARTLRLRAATTKSKKVRVIPLVDIVVADLIAVREIHRALLGRDPGPADHVFLGPRGKPVGRAYRRCLVPVPGAAAERPASPTPTRWTSTSTSTRCGTPSPPSSGGPASGSRRRRPSSGTPIPKLTAAIYTHLDVDDLREAVGKLRA